MTEINCFPLIEQAAIEMAYDNGMVDRKHSEERFREKIYWPVIASADRSDLQKLERYLRSLTSEERHLLIDGEETEVQEMRERTGAPRGGPDGEYLDKIFDDMFDFEPEEEFLCDD
jgi:hypothetical protein